MSEDIQLEQLRKIRSTVRPLLFRTGVADAPVSTCGTCFLVARKKRIFAVTAAHLIGQAHSESIMVLPYDGSQKPLELRNGFKWQPDEVADNDMIVYDVSLESMHKSESARSQVLRLDFPFEYDWKPNAFTSQFFLMGYPLAVNFVDYDAGMVKSSQVMLIGRYVRPLHEQNTIHQLDVSNPLELGHFRGMSGSPVMAIETRLASTSVVRFCGMTIWGTKESSIVHFLEANEIIGLLDDACSYWDGDYRVKAVAKHGKNR